MLKISSQEEFGLRFLLQLAKAAGDEVSLSEIAQEEGVSITYVRKIFQILRIGGLVKASLGSNAGYALTRPPADINLKEVFDILKTTDHDFTCNSFTGNLEICAHHSGCSVRPLMSLLTQKVNDFLASINLSQLVKEEAAVQSYLRTLTLTHSN
ncbi:MAG: Rrf2 family transcriptional regulator [Candidatus Caenarcaniphilales bacterium]|nr:Rrf2 family transcriptional regulator [Candidatus Caenarcaniphilales bacterium]